ncbi:MAG: PD-(D/E)XK nuclease family protein [Candidatus Rokubacteria bacterium]|nr:PD-(D/E)XK nuclease family protein [Candidatus Rokubacteria bacterium]
MVPIEVRAQPHVSFTQIDQYLRCPLKYRLSYVDRMEPDFVPVALAFGSGIHGAAAFFFRGAGQGERPSVADVQGHFEALWKLESEHRPLRFSEKETKASLLDLATRMLAVLCAEFDPRTEVVAVEQPFAVPLIDQETGEVLERDLVGTLDLLERDPEGRLVVVDLKTSARKYTSLEVEAALQLSVYSYATGLLGYADPEDVRLRFDVLTKTKQPELHRYWTTRDRAANVRLFRLAAEVLGAIEAGVFHPMVGWQCKECAFRSKCWASGGS